VFVVATQTLEVGANLDFDGMVSECASLDALRQRFGRLNRTGRDIPAQGAIVVRAEQAEDSADDPVYGASLAATWKWLSTNAKKVRKGKRAQATLEVDMGALAIAKLIPAEEPKRGQLLAQLNAPAAQAPVMFPTYVDHWAQTCPAPMPTPDPALFLHGPERGLPDVQVCWRADLDPAQQFTFEEQRREAWLEALAYCPPAAAECMAVPLHVVRSWLAGRDVAALPTSDIESAKAVEEPVGEDVPGRELIRWIGRDETEITSDPSALRPGEVLVIPAKLGGWDSFGHVPPTQTGNQIIDLAERANFLARRRAVLRLHPDVLAQWPESVARDDLIALAQSDDLEERLAEPEEVISRLRELLFSVATQESLPEWLRRIAEILSNDRQLERGLELHPCGGLIVRGSRLVGSTESTDTFSDEDDASASGTTRVSLHEHSRGVAHYARRFAQGCGLSAEITKDLELAGYCHDLGKADPRFQALLNNGNPWVSMLGGELLAKSERIPQGRTAYERARARSRYPKGGRHELLSVRLIEREKSLLSTAHDPDLVLHLVASHHGFCRPFAPVIDDSEPLEVVFILGGHRFSALSNTGLERLDSGMADRFWRLTRKYGWWGLAWLEAILRLADHRCSEAETKSRSARQEAASAEVSA
ncbi:MAG TPA: CRISPR-associated endonuclease Cas3'', partial [Steroidobacter sp.]